MKTIITTALAVFICVAFCQAQTQATTNDGKSVLLNSDGTWTLADTAKTETLTTECDSYISTEVDKVTGKSSTAAKKTIVVSKDGGKKGFGFFLMNSKNSLIISITVAGASSCIEDDAKMYVLFTDGTRLELINDGKFNCKSKYTQYLGGVFGKDSELELFKHKEIDTIRIWTSKSYVEEGFNKTQREDFKQTVNCLIAAQ